MQIVCDGIEKSSWHWNSTFQLIRTTSSQLIQKPTVTSNELTFDNYESLNVATSAIQYISRISPIPFDGTRSFMGLLRISSNDEHILYRCRNNACYIIAQLVATVRWLSTVEPELTSFDIQHEPSTRMNNAFRAINNPLRESLSDIFFYCTSNRLTVWFKILDSTLKKTGTTNGNMLNPFESGNFR